VAKIFRRIRGWNISTVVYEFVRLKTQNS